MSAPHVAGIVALMLEENPRLTAAQLQKMLIASANPPVGIDPFDVAWGFGRVDAEVVVGLVNA
jgi:subtilisin family serine protease